MFRRKTVPARRKAFSLAINFFQVQKLSRGRDASTDKSCVMIFVSRKRIYTAHEAHET